MKQPESCKGCSQARACKRAYEQLGKTRGPSVVPWVLLAFLLPLGLFVGVLAACNVLLASRVAPAYQTPLSLLIALLATTGAMLVVRAVAKRSYKRHSEPS